VGVRNQDNSSVFPAGITTGATFNRRLMYARGYALGEEFRVKGVNVALAPVAGPLGRAPAAGRNWEGFGADPYLAGT
jgi:beta-glucosidase-like glycosyl hydrolase